jgi:Domain of unknown function (DUF5916)/Carbohydrate family 9 binding domain-like
MRPPTFAILFLFSLPCFFGHAQKKNSNYQLKIAKATGAIRVDGVVAEEDWTKADVATDFYMVLPMDTSYAKLKTEVRMTYDDRNLYILAVCFHDGWKYMVESLKRDWNFGRNDNFIFFMDTFDDQTNGFTFGTNAAGAQWDGTLYEGGKADLSWDNRWTSEVKYLGDRYIFEASIPFKTIRYKKGISQWGINFSRNDLTTTEKSSWAPVPRQFPTASLAYTGVLIWDQPPPDAGLNISLIPYMLGGGSKDFATAQDAQGRKDVGGDAKIGITSSINLDLTINPDFSQVDVDRQVTNLERFELFFPERRQFFLENGDLFGNVGYATLRPFFSRRIGIATDSKGVQVGRVPIKYGLRLSGKINKNWRIGAMNVRTNSVDASALPEQDFSTFSIQRRVFSRSTISALFINKSSIGYTPPTNNTSPQYSNFNRTLGLEYNLASPNNFWTGKMLLLKSFSPSKSGDDFVQAGHLNYFNKRWNISGQYEYVGINYDAEVGYVPRQGYFKINPQAGYLFFPSAGSKVLSHGPVLSTTRFYRPDQMNLNAINLHLLDHETYMAYGITLRSRTTITPWVARNFVEIFSKFDPTNSGKDSLQAGSRHYWNSFGLDLVSKPQRLFTYSLSLREGGYYANGTRLNIATEIGYRFQPYVSITLNTSYNHLDLPAPWNTVDFWLISPRVDVTMTNKLFFTAYTQYNEQSNNVNVNTRLQWRYKPASDLFIVYSDNYIPSDFNVKNRALVVKWTYWWNL